MKVADYKSTVFFWCYTKGRIGGQPAFFWYDNDKDLKAHFPMTHLISLYGITGIGPWLVCALYKVAD